MEYKINQFIKWFAIFLSGLFSVLLVDEFLKVNKIDETVSEKYFEEIQLSDRIVFEYFVRTHSSRVLKLDSKSFDSASVGDMAIVYLTPVFKQLKSFEIHYAKKNYFTTFGSLKELREAELYLTSTVIVLGLAAAFYVKRFELRMTLFFFSCLIAGVRWWILGT